MVLVTRGIGHDHEGRADRLRAKMFDLDLDGAYIKAGPTMFYFTGFSGYQAGWPIWLTGVVLPRTGKPIGFLNAMHQHIASYAGSWVTDLRVYEDGEDPAPLLQQVMGDAGLSTARVGIEADLWSAERALLAQAAPSVDLVDVQDAIDDLRMVKDELELSLLRKACESALAGFKACHENAEVGTPAREVAAAVFDAMGANGTEVTRVGPFRHFQGRELRAGDVIAFDVGGAYQNYYSDASRTVFVGGISDELRRIHDILLDTRDKLLDMVEPGVGAEALHREACRLVARTGFDLQWRIGHGIGLEPGHEQPLLQYGSRVTLQPGMVITIDPGIHYPHPERDEPIANEDVVVVTEGGYELLTPYPTRVITG